MPILNLTITIDVDNYQEIVRDAKGEFMAFLAGVPLLNWPITHRVDSLIVDEVKSALIKQMGPKVEEKLAARGVQAKVRVE
jgi:hypothetical protein